MGKSSKKTVAKVVKKAEDVVMAEAPKPLKQGKREADDNLEKDMARSNKKKKVEEKKIEVKAQKKVVNKVVDSSEEESSESEDTKSKQVPAKKTTKADNIKNGRMDHGKKDNSSDDSETSSDDDDDDDTNTKKPVAATVKKASGAASVKKNVSSGESDSEDDSDEEVPAPAKTAAVPAKNLAPVESETESEDESESEEETSSDDDSPVPAKTKPAPAAAKVAKTVVTKKEESSSDESESDEETSSDDDSHAPAKTASVTDKNGNPGAAKNKEESSSDSDSSDEDLADHTKGPTSKKDQSCKVVKPSSSDDSDDESDDEEPQEKKAKSHNAKEETNSEESEEEEEAKNEIKKGVPAKSSSEEESSDEEDDEDEDAETPTASKKKNADVKMIDAISTKPNVQKGPSAEKIEPKTPSTAKSEGTKTVFVANLSYSVEQDDIENFLKPAGEIVAVRFSMNEDGSLRGYGHVEFSSSAAAAKAVQQFNGKDLLGRAIKIDYARERGFNTPQSGGRDTQYQRGGKPSGQTVFVRGFDKNNDEHEIRSSLEEFFGGCGDINRISIPKDPEGAFKGIAYIDFKDASALSQAVELNGSEFGNGTLTVEEARPRGDFSSGGGRDFRSGGRFSDERGRGRRGGRFSDERGRGRGRGRDRFNNDGRGRGRGSFNKPSFAASGKKTTFNDDE